MYVPYLPMAIMALQTMDTRRDPRFHDKTPAQPENGPEA